MRPMTTSSHTSRASSGFALVGAPRGFLCDAPPLPLAGCCECTKQGEKNVELFTECASIALFHCVRTVCRTAHYNTTHFPFRRLCVNAYVYVCLCEESPVVRLKLRNESQGESFQLSDATPHTVYCSDRHTNHPLVAYQNRELGCSTRNKHWRISFFAVLC